MLRRISLWCLCGAVLTAAAANTDGQTIIPDARSMPPHPHPHPHPRPHPRPWPRPPQRGVHLEVKRHTITTSIVDGVAVTDVDQVFHNPYSYTIEGTYIFPLADDVALSRFSMFVNGKEIEGRLLSTEQARREYESIVRRMRDPALLEYVGTRMFKAQIAPINPKSDVRVRISYTQMLKLSNGLVRYRYPLNTQKHTPTPTGELTVVINIESKVPIKSVFSASHKMAIVRKDDHHASASLEARNVHADRDLDLFYALSDKEFGMTVLTYREEGGDGFFLARISPPAGTKPGDVMPKDITFVVDTSGSMSGEKMRQAREALKYCLANLGAEDRFNIVSFSHEPVSFTEGLLPATSENTESARKFVDGLRGNGGTNINDALLTALAAAPTDDTTRPYLIVFLTDGEPTIGVTDPQEILKNVAAKNTARVRLFVFGVGHDVNTHLLDLLAEQNRGSRDYVAPDEDLELTLSSFYRKVAEPVLADLSLGFGELGEYDLFPPKLTDLFAGTELVVVGRYRNPGARAVELTGTRRGGKERFVYETKFTTDNRDADFLPRLWATRKVGYLLDEIRLHGENKELKDTVVELATKYGIVTPYTSYLVTEPGQVAMNQPWQVGPGQWEGTVHMPRDRGSSRKAKRRASGGRRQGVFSGSKGASVAVSESTQLLMLGDAADLAEASDAFGGDERKKGEAGQRKIERVGTRTFYLKDGRWVDASYEDGKETTKVELFSEAYFELVRKHKALAKCFALGDRVVVVIDGTTYETVLPKEEDD